MKHARNRIIFPVEKLKFRGCAQLEIKKGVLTMNPLSKTIIDEFDNRLAVDHWLHLFFLALFIYFTSDTVHLNLKCILFTLHHNRSVWKTTWRRSPRVKTVSVVPVRRMLATQPLMKTCACACSCLATWHWRRKATAPSTITTTSGPSSWRSCCSSGDLLPR